MNSALFDTALKADIIFCVDARDEMALLADKIKSVICDFPQNLAEQAEGAGGIQSVRTKVITFRDYRYSEHPLVESEFFNVLDKEQEKEFRSYVNGIVFKDGANGTANIYEAIWAALRSEW
ncbi:MAG: hypothetical protein IKB34_03695, partial [Clostridia bacterium]|nr:hypothetical protein [Clostridia bacterium]